MFVSIIVPSYNHAQYLEERINSILNQSYSQFELILLDDLSPDHSAKILEKYRKHPKVSHCIINEKIQAPPSTNGTKGCI
ncbi:glycosyl transferase 2 family protein [Acinetobacter sp. 1564232]|nr:glycosyl transferase 2 family protein [Acinetobacter sp. 1564232]